MSVPHRSTVTAKPRGTFRWAVAFIATVALVVSGSGLVAFAADGSGPSRSAEWTPAGTTVLLIARSDLPGGQEEALAQAMTAFPGFADPGSFRMKLDEALDGLVGEATDGALSWTGEIQGFFSGEIGLALPNIMEAAMAGGGDDPDILLGFSINDRDAADSFITLLTSGASDTLTTIEHGGTTIIADDTVALAVTDEWILVSQTPELVMAGIDTLGGEAPSLADDADYQASAARVPEGHLAQVYMDLSGFGDLIGLGLAMSGQPGAEALVGDMIEQLPTDMIAYLQAGPSSMTIEAFITPSDATPTVAVSESDLAASFPASTQLYIETRDLGAGIEMALTQLLAAMPPEDAAQLAPFEDMLGAPPASFLDFVGDASIGASIADDALWVGMVGEVADEAVANERLTRVLTLIGLLAAGEDSGVSVETEEVDGTSITTITLPVEEVAGEVPLPFDIGDTISLAVADGQLLIGTGPFVEVSLGLDEVDSLALSPGYVDALGDDTANSGVAYADVGQLIMTLDPFLRLLVPEWAEVAPWVGGLDRFIAVGGGDDDIISTRMTLHVEPQ